MMNKEIYKSAITKIKATDEFKKNIINRLERKSVKMNIFQKPIIAAAAVFALMIGTVAFYPQISNLINQQNNQKISYNSIYLPKIELPKNENIKGKMIGLIVYNNRIYTQSPTSIDAQNAEKLLGDKLGTTKGNITEWSKQDEYSKELASTIGNEDVYTVKGYDKDFRIMTYTKYPDGNVYPQFFDCLNGMTVNTGKDIFDKLKLKGNILNAQYRSFDEWNNGVEKFNPINDIQLLNAFISEAENTAPYTYESVSEAIDAYRTQEGFKEITLNLNDGSKTTLQLFKNGYIGYFNVYLKMENKLFEEFWNNLK